MSEDIQYTLKYKIKEETSIDDLKKGNLVISKQIHDQYKHNKNAELLKHINDHICVIVGIRYYFKTPKYKLQKLFDESPYDIDFTPDQLLKLEKVKESTGGKRKTIRRKSKNRKTKKKINGGKTLGLNEKRPETQTEKRWRNENEEIKRKKQEEDKRIKQEEDTKRILNKSLRYW